MSEYLRSHRLWVLIFLTTVGAFEARAAVLCRFLFHQQTPEVRALVQEDAFMQWLQWEQTSNHKFYRKSSEPVDIRVATAPRQKLIIEVAPHTPQALVDRFVHGDTVTWMIHPYDNSKGNSEVPYTEIGVEKAYLTASRSLVFAAPDLRDYSIKMPTVYPHGFDRNPEGKKGNTHDDVMSAVLHSEHVETQDKILSQDAILELMPEAMSISPFYSRSGFIVRDIHQLNDGHYYLPAFAIPYVGRELARYNGQKFGAFWQQHFALLLGQAKAHLLLRYGMQMETPNPQNILIQFDRDLHPTGKIFLRDLSDANFVDVVATGLGFSEQMQKDQQVEYQPVSQIKPNWTNSSSGFRQIADPPVTDLDWSRWRKSHNQAYIDELSRLLGINVPFDANATEGDEAFLSTYEFFKSPQGQEALQRFRQRVARPTMPTKSPLSKP